LLTNDYDIKFAALLSQRKQTLDVVVEGGASKLSIYRGLTAEISCRKWLDAAARDLSGQFKFSMLLREGWKITICNVLSVKHLGAREENKYGESWEYEPN
jgi:hypothetical protein